MLMGTFGVIYGNRDPTGPQQLQGRPLIIEDLPVRSMTAPAVAGPGLDGRWVNDPLVTKHSYGKWPTSIAMLV
jgi:hypothetical protein